MNDNVAVAPATQIAEYSPIAAALSDLRHQYADVVFDVATTAGLDVARKARAAIREYRYALEKKRVEIKAPALAHAKMIDDEAKRLTRDLLELESPIDAVIRAEEQRKEAERAARETAERERVAGINRRIDWIRGQPADAIGKPSADLLAAIAMVDGLALTDALYAEFLPLASAARDATAAKLREMHAAAIANESEAVRLQAEREELARQKAEQDATAAADRARLAEEIRIVRERRDAEAAAERARLDEEARIAREAREAADAKAKADRDEQDRLAREDRVLQEIAAEAARKAEQKRLDEQRAENERQQAEIERQRVAEAARHLHEVEAALASLRADSRVAEFAELAMAYKLAAPGTPTVEALAALCRAYAKQLPRVRTVAA